MNIERSLDPSGNMTIRVCFPGTSRKGFHVRADEHLPEAYRNRNKPIDRDAVLTELTAYIERNGTDRQKEILGLRQPEKEEQDARLALQNTPMGRLLVRAGFEPWNTESSARRVAEHAAEEIEELLTVLRTNLKGPLAAINAVLRKYDPSYAEPAPKQTRRPRCMEDRSKLSDR